MDRLWTPVYPVREAGRQRDALQQQESKAMATGTVKFFNNDKGYGFITQEGGR